MKFIPHSYQEVAIQHALAHKGAGLFLDMGLGKTAITLWVINQLIFNYFEVKKVLIIAPKKVAQATWSDEVEKWDQFKHLTYTKVLGTAKQRREALEEDVDIYITNRDNTDWLLKEVKGKSPFDLIILDELSSFKNSKSGRWKAMKKIRLQAKRVIGLTGTPAPKNLIDLWAQLALLDLGRRLGQTKGEYEEKYFYPLKVKDHVVIEWGMQPGAEEKLHNIISDVCISMKAGDYLELTKVHMITTHVELPTKAMKEYKKFKREKLMEWDEGVVTAVSAGVLAGKLLQFGNGAIYDADKEVIDIHSEKIAALLELIEQAQGKPVLVFYAYRHGLSKVKEALSEYNVREYHDERDLLDWNNGKIEVLLAHPASVGYGLNMQKGGNIIIWYGLTWNLEWYLQANARIARQGQQQPVFIYHLVATGTFDIRVMDILAQKGKTQNRLMKALKAEMRAK
jgi:SNF2 family DNA or RNA helicase